MSQPKVTIITVNYNGKKFLKNFFSSLNKLNYKNFEVIFFDNNSNDKSIDYVKKNYPGVRIIASNKNLGFVLANNKAAKIAKGKYLFFLNNDTKTDSQTLLILVNEMERNPKIGICGCRMMNYNGKRVYHTGIGIDIFGYPIVGKKIFYIEGSALMIKKESFEKIGGFDSQYFMFHEDIDLCWRVQLLGYQIAVFPEAIVYHFAGAKAGGGEMKKGKYKTSYLRRYYSERNNIRTLLKNYQSLTLFFIFPFYFLINLLEMLFFLLTFKFKAVYLYLKAYAWNLVNLKDTFRERITIQKSRVISDRHLMKNMYFGGGKLIALLKAGIPVLK